MDIQISLFAVFSNFFFAVRLIITKCYDVWFDIFNGIIERAFAPDDSDIYKAE